jgi:hypothetical protein
MGTLHASHLILRFGYTAFPHPTYSIKQLSSNQLRKLIRVYLNFDDYSF